MTYLANTGTTDCKQKQADYNRKQVPRERTRERTRERAHTHVLVLVPGTWNLEPGTWNLVPGTWCLEPGIRCLVPILVLGF